MRVRMLISVFQKQFLSSFAVFLSSVILFSCQLPPLRHLPLASVSALQTMTTPTPTTLTYWNGRGVWPGKFNIAAVGGHLDVRNCGGRMLWVPARISGMSPMSVILPCTSLDALTTQTESSGFFGKEHPHSTALVSVALG